MAGNSFKYTYSAKQQEEIKRIRNKYVAPEEDKMEQLRRLDRSVTSGATAVSLILGVIGTLIMGLGMSCVIVRGNTLFIPGIIIGLLGIAILSLAYPIYSRITKRNRTRLAPEIIRLTDELMK
ncbi:MAG: hypothetical protein IJP38_03200 [Oscillospiraceae bacterium]|nr:hypothetical protein [Oscillospiraceae bacterium]